MTITRGKQIKLFLVDGAPDGLLTAEIINWTGHILYAPRARIVDVLKRPEVKKSGTYLLIGKDPENPDQILVYVGEGDSVGSRLIAHNKDPAKEFWESVCVITSKDLNLTKGHVRYLESRLIEIIQSEGRALLTNGTDPGFDLLPESDISDMEEFIERLQVVLPVLGIQFVRPTPVLRTEVAPILQDGPTQNSQNLNLSRRPTDQTRPTESGSESPLFKFASPDVVAHAVELGGQMIVLSSSEARSDELPSLAANVKSFREQLRRAGKLVPSANRAGYLTFIDDVAFTSPSAAAQAVMGTSRNGRTDWVIEGTNQTYASWQQSEIAKTQISRDAE